MKEAQELAEIFPVIIDVIKKNSKEMMFCEKEDLTYNHIRIPYNLQLNNNKMVMGDLAAALGVTKGTLSTTIKKVIEKKFCVREKSKEDSRQTYICLTAKGKRAIDKEAKNMTINLHELFKKLSPKERKTILKSYKAIYEILKNFQG